MRNWIRQIIEDQIALLESERFKSYLEEVEKAGLMLAEIIQCGNKIMIAGNGGSAADAQHFAAELVGRFSVDRKPLPGISLCSDAAAVTSIANDYGYADVFSRQVQGLAKDGDCFFGISTSGNSKNVINAAKASRQLGITVISLIGKNGGELQDLCDMALVVPDESTARVQEMHGLTIHILCEMIERRILDS